MTVAELMNGRGAPTPLHEILVEWPAFWRYEGRQREIERQRQEQQRSPGGLG
jgi:hypothetical protein